MELGVRFTADVAGVVNGVRFYKGAGNTGTHTGTLWTSSGQQLATATFSGETASGWQQVTFSSPVAVAANTTYVASYHAPNGGYAHDAGYFQSSGVDNGSLARTRGYRGTAPNGVYAYGASTVYPDQTFQAANYWVDVLFTPADSTPPTVTARTPASGATGVSISAAPTATFSEAVQAATISFTLKNAANTNIPGTVAYNAGTNTATFTPGAALATGTVYTASVTGAKDTAGNTMAGTTSWSFTTQLLPTIVTDTTTANFTAGTQSSTYVAESSDGEVSLAPATGAEFGGTSLPAGWTSSTNASGGTTVVAGGTVTVDGARAYVSSTSSFGRWLEISGTFTSANPNQYLGFGTTLASGTPWAAFGTKADGNLYARSQSSASAVTETNLGTAYLERAARVPRRVEPDDRRLQGRRGAGRQPLADHPDVDAARRERRGHRWSEARGQLGAHGSVHLLGDVHLAGARRGHVGGLGRRGVERDRAERWRDHGEGAQRQRRHPERHLDLVHHRDQRRIGGEHQPVPPVPGVVHPGHGRQQPDPQLDRPDVLQLVPGRRRGSTRRFGSGRSSAGQPVALTR